MRCTFLTVFVCTTAALDSSFVSGQDDIICSDSQSSREIRCSSNEVIAVHDAVYYWLPGFTDPCSKTSVTSEIRKVNSTCRLRDKDFSTCNGETVCTVEQFMARQLLPDCRHQDGTYESNILHITYSCVPILKIDVTMVMLPLTSSQYVDGKSLRIHSPYYPCNTPNKPFDFTCNINAVPEYELSLNLTVFAKFPQTTRQQCQEKLLVEPNGVSANTLPYCSLKTESLYRNDVEQYRVPPYTAKILTFTYSKNFAEGGKYILQVEALNQYRQQVALRVSCNNQASVPSASRYDGCKPFTMPTPTTTPHTTTPAFTSRLTYAISTTTTPTIVQTDTASNAGNETGETDSSSRENSILIGVLAGVSIVIIITSIIIAIVVCRKRTKSARDMTSRTDIPSTSTEEPLSFYAVAQAVDETKSSSESASPLNPRPVYAVVTKGKKKDKVVEYDGSSDIMNDVDVVKRDSSDVIMCENTDLYDTVR